MSLLHSTGSAGISTCCPSPTTCVLGLGPDLPWADEPSPGNLGPSTGMVLTCLSLLIPAFSLLYSPHVLTVMLLPVHNAPLPLTVVNSIFFGDALFLKEICRASLHPPDSSQPLPLAREDLPPNLENRVHNRESAASVTCFSPGTSSAHNHSTSELLRTLSMYGCF